MARSSAEFQARRESALPRGVACAFPVRAERGQGAEIWDTEGRGYIDFIGGMGALAVGHSHPQVADAVRTQLHRFPYLLRQHSLWRLGAARRTPQERLACDADNPACSSSRSQEVASDRRMWAEIECSATDATSA
ncbi:aminotransferase class III-fold pyridoxal phosphate-dependent enzyme [Mesorhizobium sp. M0179]|uniref:aminotransferase class III-fold pyridoxal phosphate-dependent enzyme n=1 Tax=Mesorhizobium sp. M0179 TaxID=2956905 RepID=UPI00333D0A6F